MSLFPLICDVHVLGAETEDQIVNEMNCPELSEHGIEFMGLTAARTPFQVVRMKRDAAHLVYCASGFGNVWVKGRWEKCESGQAYLSRRFAPFGLKALPKIAWQFAWVHYKKRRSWHDLLPPESSRIIADGQPMISAITGLYRETMGQSQPNARRLWVGIIDHYWQSIATVQSQGGRLAMVWEQVDRNPSYPWTIRDLERLSGLSHEHLRRISVKDTGRTPMMQVTNLRMNRAMVLLQTTALTIQAIGELVGYSTPFSFSAAFKRWSGFPPSKYSLSKCLDG